MLQDHIDITPAPRILVALAGNPLQPIDALCELMDNAFDAFRAGIREGAPQNTPFVQVFVPRKGEVRAGTSVVYVQDNGPGLDREGLTNALRAGFGGKDRTGDLGLFGVGFNIATAKIGRKTVVTTARLSDDFALRIELDLQKLMSSGTFEVPIATIPKPPDLQQGTKVEISDWWVEGNPNAGFALRLAGISSNQLREVLSRRYSTLLQGSIKLGVMVNGELLKVLPHCVWGINRSVERAEWGTVPAQIHFDEVVHSSRRCVVDQALVPADELVCPACKGSDWRLREERIHGWVGVQRFDDQDQFGIDLIRNGRAIKLGDKDAFFKFTDEFGSTSMEYPIDQLTGRIIGEVHLDHVPVDFLKQNFELTSDEWARAMQFLRGGSLLRKNWAEGEVNDSPISRIFHGYRRVRKIGKQDMYMGTYDKAKGAAKRIDRSVEKDFFDRFRKGEEGYLDDAEWWRLVEEATIPPVEQQEECPKCGWQNISDTQECEGCSFIILGKKCRGCEAHIIRDAVTCPHCGVSQVPEINEPWRCEVCRRINEVDDTLCQECQSLIGTPDPLSLDSLRLVSEPIPAFNLDDFQLQTPSDVNAPSLSLRVYSVVDLKSPAFDSALPILSFKPRVGQIETFLALKHPIFSELGVREVDLLSMELAAYIATIHPSHATDPHGSLPVIATRVLREAWGAQIENSEITIQDQLRSIFRRISESLPQGQVASDFYQELSEVEQVELATELTRAGLLSRLTEMVQDGSYMSYASPSIMVRYFKYSPSQWFGTVFVSNIPNASSVGELVSMQVKESLIEQHARILEDAAKATQGVSSDPLIIRLTRASIEVLEDSLL